MKTTGLSSVHWRKSSRSGGESGQCVEVAKASGLVGVRDSKNPDGPVLRFSPAAWESFVSDAKHGIFDVTN